MFTWCIRSALMGVHGVTQFKKLQFPVSNTKTIPTAETVPLLRKMQLKSLLLNKLFSNLKLKKHQRILFWCFRYRIRINDKILDIVLLTSSFTILLVLPLQKACKNLLLKLWNLVQLSHDGGRYHVETSPLIAPQINGLVSIW